MLTTPKPGPHARPSLDVRACRGLCKRLHGMTPGTWSSSQPCGAQQLPKPLFPTGQAQSDQFLPNTAHCAHTCSLTLASINSLIPMACHRSPQRSPESVRLMSLSSSSEVPPSTQRVKFGFCDLPITPVSAPLALCPYGQATLAWSSSHTQCYLLHAALHPITCHMECSSPGQCHPSSDTTSSRKLSLIHISPALPMAFCS